MSLIRQVVTVHPTIAPLLVVDALEAGKTGPLSHCAGDVRTFCAGGRWGWRRTVELV